jgi:exodeoxyribonuclease V alpha subunit
MRIGPAGYMVFNQIIQDIVNPTGERVEVGDQAFRIGDRVMQMSNNYELDVFNGDIGFIRSVDAENRELIVEFPDQTVKYPFKNVNELTLSYAVSIHKSQGSEYKVVLLIMLSHHYVMLDRNLIYTATTRGQDVVIYLASRGAIDLAINTQKVLKRNSLLTLRLRTLIPRSSTKAA